MCYYLGNSSIKTATEDITVYKVVEKDKIKKDGFKSAYQGFKYIFGKIYKNEYFDQNAYRTIDNGFHSYKTNYRINKDSVSFSKRSSYSIQRQTYYNGIVVECIIPKGSLYYFNGVDYVSNSIQPICFLMHDKEQMPKQLREYYSFKTIK